MMNTDTSASRSLLRVSDDRRRLVRQDGQPFFWLADTAWRAPYRLTRSEMETYLQTRADQGFTVIQTVAVDRRFEPGVTGHAPFVDGDPEQPDETFFGHLDFFVRRAVELGFVVALLPAWGFAVTKERILTEDNAAGYGAFLAARYRDLPIVWVLGGDQPGTGFEGVWRAEARGLAGVHGGAQLMTFHPKGGQSSSWWFHGDDWLDFNMIQSGHRHNAPTHRFVQSDWGRTPEKPVLDAESVYENIPHGLSLLNVDADRLTAHDVRKAAYWSTFAGGFGYSYGCNEVFQFWKADEDNPLPAWGGRVDWQKALRFDGAEQMRHLKNLFLSRPGGHRPAQHLLAEPAGNAGDHVRICRVADGPTLLGYSPNGRPFTLRPATGTVREWRAWWYDPRTGGCEELDAVCGDDNHRFTPPSHTEDWVLVLDDVAAETALPGKHGVV